MHPSYHKQTPMAKTCNHRGRYSFCAGFYALSDLDLDIGSPVFLRHTVKQVNIVDIQQQGNVIGFNIVILLCAEEGLIIINHRYTEDRRVLIFVVEKIHVHVVQLSVNTVKMGNSEIWRPI